MDSAALRGGFADPSLEAARAFRAALSAMAEPGTIRSVAGATPPAPLSPAAGALLLTFCDATTPLHLAGHADCDPVRRWVGFHLGAPLVGPGEALFALGSLEALCPLGRFATGTPEYPDRSATLIIEVARLGATGARLTGPGILGAAWLDLPAGLAEARAALPGFPLGLDMFLTCGDRFAALPRTTKVEAG